MSITILLIDDEVRVLQSFARNVRLAGYRVLTAGGARAGLDLYHQEQPDIVMTDLRMPEMDGLAVLRAIRQHDPEANVILVSGHGDKDAILEALRSGASDFLPKPVDQVALESALRRAAERVHLTRELRASQEALRQQNVQLEATVRERTADLEREIAERKRTEVVLRQTMQRFQALLDYSPALVHIFDETGRYLLVGEATVHVLGLPREEIIGQTFADLLPPETAATFMERVAALQAGQAKLVVEDEITLNGATQFFETLLFPLSDEDGVQIYAGIASDITERKQLENTLRLHSLVLDQIEDLVTVTDLEGVITYVNQAEVAATGRSREEIIGQSTVIYGEDAERGATQRAIIEQTLREGAWRGEVINFAADGSERVMDCRTQVVYDEREQPIALCGIATDITERKQLENTLRDREQRYHQLFEAAPISVWEEDFSAVKRRLDTLPLQDIPDLRAYFQEHPELVQELTALVEVVDVNQATLRLYHTDDKDVFFAGIGQIFTETSYQNFIDILLLIAAGGTTFEAEEMHVTLDGQTLHAQLHWAVAPGHEDTYARVLVSIVDITAQKRMEEALREQSAQMTDLLESITDAFFALDDDLTVTYFNQAAERILGRDRHEVLGQRLFDAFPTARGSVFEENYRYAIREKQAMSFEVCFDDPQYGNWYAVNVYPQQQGISVYFQIITDRKQIEAALRESEKQHRRLFEIMARGVIYQAADGAIISANPAAERMLGLTLDQLRGKTSLDPRWKMILEDGTPVPGSDHPSMIALRTGEQVGPVIRGFYIPERDVYVWLEITAVPLFEPGEARPFQVYVTFDDITARKQAEDALRESEEKFRALFDQSTVGIYLHDLEGRVLDVNARACAQSGYTREAWLGRTIFDLHPRESQVNLPKAAILQSWKAWQPGQRQIIEAEHQRQDGTLYPVEISTGVVRYGDQNVILALVKDITERKQAEAQIKAYADHLEQMVAEKIAQLDQERAKVIQMDKLASLGQLATSVAHELNQPLMAMGLDAGYLTLLVEKAREQEAARINLDDLENVGQGLEADVARCRRIIDHLRGFGRIADETLSYVDLSQPLEDSFILIEAQLHNHQVTVDWQLAEDLPFIEAHPHKLEQVFINLITNAEHAMQSAAEQDGREKILTLSTRQEGDWVLAEVRDNGCGIPEDVQKRLFEPFFTTKPSGEGTGLGLPICHGIVTECGGEIACESVEGEGTAFILRFPIAE